MREIDATATIPDLADGEILTTSDSATRNLPGRQRHAFEVEDEETPTYSSLCNRKTGPSHIHGKSLEVLDAHEYLFSEIDPCTTCLKRTDAEAHIDYELLHEAYSRAVEEGLVDADEADGPTVEAVEPDDDDGRIPVKLAAAMEIDFPADAKYDLLEVVGGAAKLLQRMDGSGSDLKEAVIATTSGTEIENA